VIKPPSDLGGDNHRFTRLAVDSRIRDKDLFPNPNHYDLLLDDDINDVVSAQLIYVDMPLNAYTINEYFNTLNFIFDNSSYKIVLDTGNYDATTLLEELNLKFDNLLGVDNIMVSYNRKKDSYSFTSTKPFSFLFPKTGNTLSYLLGFRDGTTYTSSQVDNEYVISSEFKLNFNYNNYAIMDIEQFDVLKSIDSDLNKSFALIPRAYNIQNIIDLPQYIKRFSPPIGKLAKLRVKIYDRFGNDYDFQNQDHRFEILITSFKQQRKYANIFAA
jgi:hypothetical protein